MSGNVPPRNIIMPQEIEYRLLTSKEACGSSGWFAIKILVAGSNLPELRQDAINAVGYQAVDLIESEICAARIAADPEAQVKRKREREELLALFDEPIFVEEIPNGYCSRYCCRHIPWFIVTTRIGRFKIGWRKSVINIDWSQTVGTKTSAELFPDDDVTKDERSIHAWSYENARRYIITILNNPVNPVSA